ncbi:MAG: hypothetical protein ACYTDV_18380, partial [Planctomycetota bacterium]
FDLPTINKTHLHSQEPALLYAKNAQKESQKPDSDETSAASSWLRAGTTHDSPQILLAFVIRKRKTLQLNQSFGARSTREPDVFAAENIAKKTPIPCQDG